MIAYLIRRLLVVVAVLACLALSWMVLPLLRGDRVTPPATSAVTSAGDRALQQVDALLAQITAHTTGDRPTDLPNALQVGAVCWSRLQTAMAANDNQYNLVLLSVTDSSSDPRATQHLVQVYVQVSFPDGTALKVLAANDDLVDCSPV